MDIGNALKASFMQTHEDLLKECDETGEFDCALSGTTATVCVVDQKNNRLWTASAGDSRAILGRCSKRNKKIRTVDLTQDHKCNLPNEKKRIMNSGGEVRKLEGDVP